MSSSHHPLSPLKEEDLIAATAILRRQALFRSLQGEMADHGYVFFAGYAVILMAIERLSSIAAPPSLAHFQGEQYFNSIYKVLLGRPPDPEGTAYWQSQVDLSQEARSITFLLLVQSVAIRLGEPHLAERANIGLVREHLEAVSNLVDVVRQKRGLLVTTVQVLQQYDADNRLISPLKELIAEIYAIS